MTKEEFKRRAQEIYDMNEGFAGEDGHIQVDLLMKECLESLGYGEGIKIMNKMSNFWYA